MVCYICPANFPSMRVAVSISIRSRSGVHEESPAPITMRMAWNGLAIYVFGFRFHSSYLCVFHVIGSSACPTLSKANNLH